MGNDTGWGPEGLGCEGEVGLEGKVGKPQPWISGVRSSLGRLLFAGMLSCAQSLAPLGSPGRRLPALGVLPAAPPASLSGRASPLRVGITDSWLRGHTRRPRLCAPVVFPWWPQFTLEWSVTLELQD